MARKPYPSEVKDNEWEFGAPYLALVREYSPQREHDLREIHNALRWVARAALWRRPEVAQWIEGGLPGSRWETQFEARHRWHRRWARWEAGDL